jgi:signal peptidase
MLVSCQFKYGAIVIGSESMTGTINKGDVVVFERYDGGAIEENTVVLFDYNNIKTVHRIITRENVNGEVRYTTKGDSNTREDFGYRKKQDIKGIVKIRIKYIGLLTLWFRSLFE